MFIVCSYRTIASVILTAEIISNRSDTNKNQRYGNITLSFTLDLVSIMFKISMS